MVGWFQKVAGNAGGRRGAAGERGQTVVEFALILPVLVLVLFGIAEFGRALSAYLTIQNAAREGARLAITGAGDADIEARVREKAEYLGGAGDPAVLTVSVQPDPASRQAGTDVTVSVYYRFRFIAPVISNITGQEVTLWSVMSMRI